MGKADLAGDRLAGRFETNARHDVLGGRWPGELWYQRDPEPLRDKGRRDRVVGGLKRDLRREPRGRAGQLESDAVWIVRRPGDEHFIPQLCDRDHLLTGEPVSCGDYQSQGVVQHGSQSDVGGRRPGHARVAVGDDSVDITGGELREPVWRLEMKQGQLEIGMSRRQPFERIRQQILRRARKRPDAERAQLPGRLPHGKLGEVSVSEQPLGAGAQYLAGRGDPHAAGATHEQLAPHFALQQSNVLRDGRRRVPKRLSGRRKGPQPCSLDKRTQPLQLHTPDNICAFGWPTDPCVDFRLGWADLEDMNVPEPPNHSFASDNVASAHPHVIEALIAANTGSAGPYGDDPWTRRATRKFRDLLDADVEVLLTYGGTGANVVALQSILAPHEAVICPSGAHINVEECGAAERFTGAKLIDIPSDDGKLRPDAITDLLRPARGEHNVKPRVLAISQVTELGSVYTVEEITQLAELAHTHGLLLFMDGARIANAAAALGCSLRELTVDAGVDVLTFGGTKNGLVYGEAVIYLRPELATRARFARKQAGQLASKMRFIAAQFDALLTDQLWLDNAHHANRAAALLADRIADTPHVEMLRAPQANSIFACLPEPAIEPLQNWSFFWTWDASKNLVRWMTSFATAKTDVARFADGVRHFTRPTTRDAHTVAA